MRFMPIPIIDASQALKTSPEKTEDALLKVTQVFLSALQLLEKQSEGAVTRLFFSVIVSLALITVHVSPD